MLSSSNRPNWIFQAFLALAIAALFIMHFTQRPPKLAYVESGRLLEDYTGTVEAKRAYQHQRQEWQRNLDTLRAETERELAAYQRERPNLSPAQRQEAETRLRLKQEQFYQYRQAVEEGDQKEQQRFSQQVLDSTNKFLKYYGQRNGYDMILLTSDGDNLAFAKEAYNITIPVLKELNESYSAAKKEGMPGKGQTPAK